MSVENVTMQNIVGSNKIKDDFGKLNRNDNALLKAILEHIRGEADKHNISDIVNDSSVTGDTVKAVLELIYKTILDHAKGTSNRHKTSYIDNDTIITGVTLKDVLEVLKSEYTTHVNGTSDKHNAISILFNNVNIAEITATDVQNAIIQTNERLSNIITNAGDSNIEIVDARYSTLFDITFSTLKQRLDYAEKIFNEATTYGTVGYLGNAYLGSTYLADL